MNKVYCLIRASSPIEAYKRLHDALHTRYVYSPLSSSSKAKLIALPAPTLSHPTLSLPEETYNTLLTETTDIIHCAWPVNFNLQLSSLAQDTLPTLHNLLSLALKAQRPEPATFNFCSSVSSVVNSAVSPIPETLPESLTAAQSMGYAQSKLIAEHICANATPYLDARVLRIGQIIGDTKHGVWNATEAIPLMLRAAVTVGALPRLDERMRWVPVDVVAAAVMDITLHKEEQGLERKKGADDVEVYNILNPYSFHWTKDLLPALRAAGFGFEDMEFAEWIKRVKDLADPERNPPVKLVGFWEGKYGSAKPFRGLEFVTEKARERAEGLRELSAEGLEGGLVGKMVEWFRDVAWV